MDYDYVIVGSGINALVAGAMLGKKGASVLLLDEQGLIRRIARLGDRRVRDISITQSRQAFESVWPILYEQFQQLFDGVQEEEYRAFVSTLHRILRNIRKREI